MTTHYTIQCGALLPILWCITYYLCRLGSISGFISCYCTPLSPIYRKDIFSFQSLQYLILSCVLSTLCKEVPPSKRILIFICCSLLRHGLLYSCLLMIFFPRTLVLDQVLDQSKTLDSSTNSIQCNQSCICQIQHSSNSQD